MSACAWALLFVFLAFFNSEHYFFAGCPHSSIWSEDLLAVVIILMHIAFMFQCSSWSASKIGATWLSTCAQMVWASTSGRTTVLRRSFAERSTTSSPATVSRTTLNSALQKQSRTSHGWNASTRSWSSSMNNTNTRPQFCASCGWSGRRWRRKCSSRPTWRDRAGCPTSSRQWRYLSLVAINRIRHGAVHNIRHQATSKRFLCASTLTVKQKCCECLFQILCTSFSAFVSHLEDQVSPERRPKPSASIVGRAKNILHYLKVYDNVQFMHFLCDGDGAPERLERRHSPRLPTVQDVGQESGDICPGDLPRIASERYIISQTGHIIWLHVFLIIWLSCFVLICFRWSPEEVPVPWCIGRDLPDHGHQHGSVRERLQLFEAHQVWLEVECCARVTISIS